jgi:hypothetical protein
MPDGGPHFLGTQSDKRKGQAIVKAGPKQPRFGGRGLDGVWPGFSVAAFKKTNDCKNLWSECASFQRRGCLLLYATYRPVDGLSEEAHEKVILQSYSALVAELTKMLSDKSTPILLVRTRVRQVLERRLRNDGFTLLTYAEFAALQAAAE